MEWHQSSDSRGCDAAGAAVERVRSLLPTPGGKEQRQDMMEEGANLMVLGKESLTTLLSGAPRHIVGTLPSLATLIFLQSHSVSLSCSHESQRPAPSQQGVAGAQTPCSVSSTQPKTVTLDSIPPQISSAEPCRLPVTLANTRTNKLPDRLSPTMAIHDNLKRCYLHSA